MKAWALLSTRRFGSRLWLIRVAVADVDSGGNQPAEPRRTVGKRLRFLVTPRWISLIVAAISFALACYFLLAPWQFGRSAEQSEQNRAIAAALAADPVDVAAALSVDAQPSEGLIWHLVTASGHYTGEQGYIRLRHDNDGTPAFEVVAEFATDAGPSVLVDRGYVPFTDVEKGVALAPLPQGHVTVSGRVQADQVDPKNRPAIPAPDGRQQFTAVNSQIITDTTAYRGYLQLVEDAPGVIDPIALPEEDAGPFFSYAIQWLSFGAIAIIGVGYFIYREFTDPVTGDIYLPDDEPAGDDGPRAGPAGVAAVTAVDEPRRRRRFDKSQLYDRE